MARVKSKKNHGFEREKYIFILEHLFIQPATSLLRILSFGNDLRPFKQSAGCML